MRIRFLLSGCLFLITSCHCNQSTKTNNPNKPFIKEIPYHKNGKISVLYTYINDFLKKTNLSSIEKGFDSLQIRFWVIREFENNNQLIEIKYKKSDWSARLYSFTYHFGEATTEITSVSKKKWTKEPSSGWNSFIKKIFDLKILELPDCDKIPNYNSPTDGDFIIVEIATENSYRFYSYNTPQLQNGIWQAKNIMDILRIMEKEFQVTLLE